MCVFVKFLVIDDEGGEFGVGGVFLCLVVVDVDFDDDDVCWFEGGGCLCVE